MKVSSSLRQGRMRVIKVPEKVAEDYNQEEGDVGNRDEGEEETTTDCHTATNTRQ